MVVGEVNPLEQRHMALSSRFKAAWAFQQLLIGMQKIGSSDEFENKSDTFQALFGRLRELSERLQEATIGKETLDPEMTDVENEVDALYRDLARQEAIGGDHLHLSPTLANLGPEQPSRLHAGELIHKELKLLLAQPIDHVNRGIRWYHVARSVFLLGLSE